MLEGGLCFSCDLHTNEVNNNPFKHHKSNCIKTYVKFQANQMKFDEFMESQFELNYTGNRI